MKRNNDLTQGPIAAKLTKLTIPVVFGMLAMVAFNLADTFFVSRLGTRELAAMGFIFPVVMFVISIALGLSVAASSVISRAIGRGHHHKVMRLTTDSLVISFFVVGLVAVAGFFSMDKVFALLGASADMIPLIKQYMSIWYFGVAFVVIPMVGNSAIRAGGDTLFPSLIMVASTVINIALDPLLIFGLWGFPRMELAGAALATVIARGFSLLFALSILHFRERLIDFSRPKIEEVIESCRRLLYIGIPSAGTRILFPFIMAIIMRLVAQYGVAAVAAVGAALRIEMFVFVVVMALASALMPFTGQNWGARKYNRVKTALGCSNKFSFWWGAVNCILFLIFARPIGKIFSNDPAVYNNIAYYLWIIPISYGPRSVSMLIGYVFNAINRPLAAAALSIVRMLFLYVVLAYFGSLFFGLLGIFLGICLANFLSGLLAVFWSKRVFHKVFSEKQI